MNEIELPYEYSDNTRGGTLLYVAASVILTGVLVAVHFFLYALPWLVITAPIIVVAIRAILFLSVRNGVHEALRDAQMDKNLDDYMEEEYKRRQKRTLTPSIFTATLKEEDD